MLQVLVSFICSCYVRDSISMTFPILLKKLLQMHNPYAINKNEGMKGLSVYLIVNSTIWLKIQLLSGFLVLVHIIVQLVRIMYMNLHMDMYSYSLTFTYSYSNSDT